MSQFLQEISSTGRKIYSSIFKVGGRGSRFGAIEVYDDNELRKVVINKDGIALENGAKLIGADGLITNISANSLNLGWLYADVVQDGSFFLGYNTDSSTNWANFLEFNVYIPNNFTITDAKITFIHTPVNWDNGGDYDFWGYCRNIKAYKVTNANNIVVVSTYASEYSISGSYTESEISGSFGVSGYTPSIPTDLSHLTETTVSSDIKSSLTVGVNNKILIKSSDAIPTFSATPVTNWTNVGQKTGYATAILNVIGYYTYS